MCSMYWTLMAGYRCPHCQKFVSEAELQTHWQGEGGSCSNFYRVWQPIAELAGLPDGEPDMDGDAFGDECPYCGNEVAFRIELRAGAIVRIWPTA